MILDCKLPLKNKRRDWEIWRRRYRVWRSVQVHLRQVVPIQVKTGEEVKGGERRATIRPLQDQRRITTGAEHATSVDKKDTLNEIVL